ncbi:Dynein light chain Tctex-type [Sparganum proliferum]
MPRRAHAKRRKLAASPPSLGAKIVTEDIAGASNIENTVGSSTYVHSKVNQWTSTIIEQVLNQLTKLGKPFKYIVTCVIMQKCGAGLHTASSCYWDNTTDGSCTVRWENKSMTYFTFDGTIYEQVKGTPMGSPISGFIAEAVLQRLESLVFQHHKPKFWARYVDDTFVLIEGDKVLTFQEHLNAVFPDIQFTMEEEENNQLAFLDVLRSGEDLVHDQEAWRTAAETGTAIFQINRVAAAEAKGETRKRQMLRTNEAGTQTLLTGLVEHLQTPCDVKTTNPPPKSQNTRTGQDTRTDLQNVTTTALTVNNTDSMPIWHHRNRNFSPRIGLDDHFLSHCTGPKSQYL